MSIQSRIIPVESSWGVETWNQFISHEPPSSALTVLFPGATHSCEAPLLWYARKAALEAGADVLALEYGYWAAHRTPNFDADTDRIVDEATAAIQQVLSNAPYTSLVFVSKSIGTYFAGLVAKRIPDRPIRHLFLTPVPPSIPLMLEQGGAFVVGDRDPALSHDEIAHLSRSLPVTVFPGAKHSLEVNGDVPGSLHILSQVASLCGNMVRGLEYGSTQEVEGLPSMKVVALNVGAPVVREYQGREVRTAFFKYPVTGPLHLGKLGFTGDSVVDDVHHGGPDKAALLYSTAHYPYWAQVLGHDPGPAAMGENLTVEGLTEETVCIGDIYRVGGATVQISQPRVPCFKTAIRHGVADMAERVAACGFTGFYIRVLEEGPIQAGDAITLVSRIAGAPTVARLNHVMHHDKQNVEAARALVDTEALAEAWRDYFRRRLG